MTIGIFIFRRDLRIIDNTALIRALKSCDKVLPIFIFDPVQISSKNQYKSNNCIQFMIESLLDLSKDIPLQCFHGNVIDVLDNIFHHFNYENIEIYVNIDYSPYSIKRDAHIKSLCDKHAIPFNSFEDITLLPIEQIKTTSGTSYTKFTPFFRAASKFPIRKIDHYNGKNYYFGNLKSRYAITLIRVWKFTAKNKDIHQHGGRDNALKILRKISEYRDYNKTRNYPTQSTTNLSAFNKFGCVSIREVYWTFVDKLGKRNELIKQLYWRDFYYNIIYHYPHVIGHSFQPKFEDIKWHWNAEFFKRWRKGRTGFPIVDAGMRQLKSTGFMHNRCRMIVASFLIKDLHIDWRDGEKYFATQLYDYDIAQNNGGWQWCSGTGTDVQPYFRIFNPWLQSKKYDPDCKYIKRWLPELDTIPAKHIHEWYKYWPEYNGKYPKPIVEHEKEKKITIKMYK